MNICPLCNGLEQLNKVCTDCGQQVEDKGRIMDYYDDYSAYMPIDQMKLENGYPDLEKHLCPHLVLCESCGMEDLVFIQEQKKEAGRKQKISFLNTNNRITSELEK